MLDTGQREGKQPVPLQQKATRPEKALQFWWWLAFPIALFFFLFENLLILQVHSHFYPWLSTPGKGEGKLRPFWATFPPVLRRCPGWVWMQVDVLGMDADGCAGYGCRWRCWVWMQVDVLKDQSYSGGSHASAASFLLLTYLMQGSLSLPNVLVFLLIFHFSSHSSFHLFS